MVAALVVVGAVSGTVVWRLDEPLGYAAFAIVLAGSAAAFVGRTKARVVVDDEGLLETRAFGWTRIAWPEVAAYRYSGADGLVVRTGDGRSIAIDDRYARAGAARSRALAAVHRVLRDRGDVGYEPFELRDATLSHRQKGALALAEIERVAVDASQIAVLRRGKKRWTFTSIRAVDNSLLLLDELSARGVTVKGRIQLER